MYRELFIVGNLLCCILISFSTASDSNELPSLELERRIEALERITRRNVKSVRKFMTINTINHSTVCINNDCKSSEELGLNSSEKFANAKTYHANLDLQMDYLSALQWCSARYMKLATINSVAENEQFINKTKLPYEVNYWIGLTQTHENLNVWFHSGKAPKFTHWDEGEPNTAVLEGCGAASSITGKWFIKDCSLKNHFACELDSVVLTVY